MVCLSGFEIFSRWVPLVNRKRTNTCLIVFSYLL